MHHQRRVFGKPSHGQGAQVQPLDHQLLLNTRQVVKARRGLHQQLALLRSVRKIAAVALDFLLHERLLSMSFETLDRPILWARP